MLDVTAPLPRNRLLAALSDSDRAALQPHLRPTTLLVERDLERPNRPIPSVFFIEAGIASVVAVQANDKRVEVGLVGREGMSGTAIVLGGDQSPHHTYMQATGEGQQIAVVELQKAMRASDTLHALLLKYVQVFMVQTAQTAIANASTTLSQRLARWLLMAQDRLGVDTLPLTHEFLSLMLAVRRAGVTEALQTLKRKNLIETGRNKIIVRDRKGLERAAGAFYGVPEAEFRRLIG
jgi:CRP-like cAMP-binding protein